MSAPSIQAPAVVEVFSGILTVGALEQQLSAAKFANEGDIIFDLDQVMFLETTTLVLFLALIVKYENQGRRLLFNLPEHKDVRDFIRAWNFPEAAARASKYGSFVKLTTIATHKYFGENEIDGNTNAYLPASPLRPSKFVQHHSAYFYPFQILDREHTPFTDALAITECETWSGSHIQAVLKGLLPASPQHVPRDIVFEAMANAVRHPGATHIFAVSHLGRKRGLTVDKPSVTKTSNGAWQEPAHVSLCWWDNGMSIVDTLREPLDAGKAVRVPGLQPTIEISLRIFDVDGEQVGTRTLDENTEILASDSRELLLAAAMLPGVTRDPNARAAVPPAEPSVIDASGSDGRATDRELTGAGCVTGLDENFVAEADRGTHPGMGLHYLLRAAIDSYGGAVSIRTKNLFLHIKAKRKKQPGKYTAKVVLYPEACSVPGNMVTVRIPCA